jgi:hypothetical protein
METDGWLADHAGGRTYTRGRTNQTMMSDPNYSMVDNQSIAHIMAHIF